MAKDCMLVKLIEYYLERGVVNHKEYSLLSMSL